MTTIAGVGLLSTTGCSLALDPPSGEAERDPALGTGLGALKQDGTTTGGGPPLDPPIGEAEQDPAIGIGLGGLKQDGINTGGGTTNGLKPETYYPNVDHINGLMREPLNNPWGLAGAGNTHHLGRQSWLGTFPLPQPLSGGYQPQESEVQNRLLLADMIGCAFATGETWDMTAAIGEPDPSFQGFIGEGLLQGPGQSWLTSPLSDQPLQRAVDVHTCLIARLNAFGRPVPIWLKGIGVTSNPAVSPPNHYFREAVWLAVPDLTVGALTKIALYALPLDGLTSRCSTPDEAIQWRICGRLSPDGTSWTKVSAPGSTPNQCHVNVLRTPSDPSAYPRCTEATPGQGDWTCTLGEGGPTYNAIETRLAARDWHLLYDCGSQCAGRASDVSRGVVPASDHGP
ncbi:hypothetical protein [Sorangium sp. So ce131]|uniref:hypothetical protein n=1 Tax=Sorangium sp. So ce131 TaxID=3133282 RepID=UPI003F5F153C